MRQRFIDFLEQVRLHPFLKDAWIIYIGESNTGQVSASHGVVIQEMDKADYIKDELAQDAGVWTTRERKVAYLVSAREEFSRRGLPFIKDPVILSDDTMSEESRYDWLHKQLFKQIRRVKPIASMNNSQMTPTFESWSAKMGEDGKPSKTLNDDLVFALFMTIFWMTKFLAGELSEMNMSKYNALFPSRAFRDYRRRTATSKMPATLMQHGRRRAKV